jgi:hypothetical protein
VFSAARHFQIFFYLFFLSPLAVAFPRQHTFLWRHAPLLYAWSGIGFISFFTSNPYGKV